MTFKTFVLVSQSFSMQKNDSEILLEFIYTWVISLIFSPYIFLLNFPRSQYFCTGDEGAFSFPEQWCWYVLTIDLSCFYFKNFISRVNWTGMANNPEDSSDTHTDTQLRLSCRLWGRPQAVHNWIQFPPGFVMLWSLITLMYFFI